MAVELEDAVDGLFAVEPDAFVASRTELVRALRAEGRRDEAAEVQRLRRPALSVWAVNQLARRHRKEVDLLLDAGNRLAVAQRGLPAGEGRAAFDDARVRLQESLSRLVELARALLGEHATAATLERVATTLRAAAVSDEARPELARGRLTADVEPAGFDALAGSLPAPRPGAVPARKQAEHEKAARREALEEARAALKAAEEREASIAKELRAAERAAADAAEAARSADEEAARLRAEQEEAARAVESARERLESLRSG
jgi:hypothetical protein